MTKPCVKCGAADRDKRGNCRPCALERGRKWNGANKDRKAAYQQLWKAANVDKNVEYRRKYNAANREKLAAARRAYKVANPDKVAEYGHKRRATKNKSGGILTATDIRAIYAAYPTCLACGSEDGLSLDHVIPIVRGGRNSIENMQVLCCRCNSSKGSKILDYREEALGGWRQMNFDLII